MPTIAYTITLEQPLLATSLLGDPNSTVSYDYVPGSTLRGLFAGRYRRGADGSDDAQFRRLFLSGKVRFLNAYPVASDSTRSLPTPRSLQREKLGRAGLPVLINRAIDPEASAERWKAVSHPFCAPLDTRLQLIEPLRSVEVHVQRDRRKGRAWLERDAEEREYRYGTVFRYEALAAGQQFAALIVTDDTLSDEDLTMIGSLLQPATCWLGRSRSAGYGRARLEAQAVTADWYETPLAELSSDIYTMTLLSPAILVSSVGDELQQPDDATLSTYLGCNVQIVPERSFTDVELVGGFNRHWGLPLPQRRALVMGSVISFRVTEGKLDPASIQTRGIGERLAEGFGRVAFNWLAETSYQGQTVEGAQPVNLSNRAQAAVSIPPALKKLAERTATRVADARVDAAILSFVEAQVWPLVQREPNNREVPRMPSNSLLSRLRTLVRQASARGDTKAVLSEFLHFRDTARSAYERARFGGGKGSLADWIYALLDQPESVWDELGLIEQPKVGDVAAPESDLRTRQVALRLLGAVLAAPAQLRKGREYQEREARP